MAASLFFMKSKKYILALLSGLSLVICGLATWIYVNRNNGDYSYVPDISEASAQEALGGTQLADSGTKGGSKSPQAGLGFPKNISIPSVNIDLSIAKGYYNNQNKKWTLSKNYAHYAVMTPRPNSRGGNTFIYGHNRSAVFARLPSLKLGSVAQITTSDNKAYSYKLKRIYTTNPNDSSLLSYEGPPILTLQTCTGANFQNRTLFVFEYQGVADVS